MSRYLRIDNEDGTFTDEKVYTAQDMEAFAEWLVSMTSQWIYDPTDKVWFQKHSTETKTTAQLREIWEIETGRKEEME